MEVKMDVAFAISLSEHCDNNEIKEELLGLIETAVLKEWGRVHDYNVALQNKIKPASDIAPMPISKGE